MHNSVRPILKFRWYQFLTTANQRVGPKTRWDRFTKLGGTDSWEWLTRKLVQISVRPIGRTRWYRRLKMANQKVGNWTRWHQSGMLVVPRWVWLRICLGFESRWDRIGIVGLTDLSGRVLDRVFVKELVGVFGDYHLCTWSILFANSTLPPFNSIGFPMDSKWFLTK